MFRVFTLTLALVMAPLALAAETEETPLPNPLVTVKTSDGSFTLRLFRDKAPVTVENFLKYVDEGYYNGTIFHRVIPDFMIQGGGFLADMSEKPTAHAPIENESRNRVHNTRGTVAMARTNDPDSATSQFFVNLRNNLRLDWAPGREGYTVFGEVIEGMKVVDFIATVPTGQSGPHGDVPKETVTIIEVKRKSLL